MVTNALPHERGPGPTGEPYPSGSRPAGPDAESMDPDVNGLSDHPASPADVPSALGRVREIRARLGSAAAVFVDFDEVLLAERAVADDVRQALRRLSGTVPVVVISRGSVDTAVATVAVDALSYVGNDGDRGKAVADLLARLDGRVAVFIGGRGDEGTFATVRTAGGVTIVVDPEFSLPTRAEFRLDDLAAATDFLLELTRSLTGDALP